MKTKNFENAINKAFHKLVKKEESNFYKKINTGFCVQCGKKLDMFGYFAGVDTCDKCCRKNYTKAIK